MLKMNDKQQHFVAGLLIALLFGWLVYPAFGFFMAVLIGGLKEMVWDILLDRGTPEMRDFVATAQGGIVGCILLFLYRFIGG
jgi:hypothetical protein